MPVAPPDAPPAGGVLAPSSSLLQQALLFVALGWLFARVVSIVRQPKAELAEFIGLAEPAKPVILVEGLGSTWAAIYWYYPSSEGRSAGKRRPKARKYVVSVGNQVIEAAREQRRVVVEGLEPDTSYKVLVRAIQAASPHSHSHLHHSNSNSSSTSSASGAGSGIEEGISSILGSSDSGSAIVASSIYLHTLNSGPVTESVPPLSTLLRDQPLEPISLESTQEITALQAETRSVLEQFDASEAEYGVKYRALIQEYNAVNEQRKLDESQRAHLRAESKACEDRKHALDVQLSKLKQRATKVTKYRADIESSAHQLVELEQQHAERKREHQQKIEALESEYHALAAREERLSRSAKEMSQRLKHAEAQTATAREFLNKLKDTGHHVAGQQLELLAASGEAALGAQGKDLVEHELELDERIEREWVRAQKSLEQRYVEAYLQSSEKEAQRLVIQSQSQSQSQLPLQPQPQTQTQPQLEPPAHQPVEAQAPPQPQPQIMTGTSTPTHNSPRESLDACRPTQGSLSLTQNSSMGPGQHTPPTPGSVKDLSNHNSVLGVNGSLMPPPHSPGPTAMPSFTSLQSAPSVSLRPSTSIPSFDSMPSVQSLRAPPPIPSASPLSNLAQSNSTSSSQMSALNNAFTGVAAPQPFGAPYPFGGQAFPYSGHDTPAYMDADEVMLSPSAARDLIPSNLFQDSDYGEFDSAEGDANLDMQETPRAPSRAPNKDSSPWLPWLSPHTRSHNRSSSLFFGSPNESSDSPNHSVFTSYADTFEPDEGSSSWQGPNAAYGADHDHEQASGAEHEHEHETEHEDDLHLASSPTKTPRKRGGSRFFHKTGSGSKHGNFVRRLSIFSRKDAAEGTDSGTNGTANHGD